MALNLPITLSCSLQEVLQLPSCAHPTAALGIAHGNPGRLSESNRPPPTHCLPWQLRKSSQPPERLGCVCEAFRPGKPQSAGRNLYGGLCFPLVSPPSLCGGFGRLKEPPVLCGFSPSPPPIQLLSPTYLGPGRETPQASSVPGRLSLQDWRVRFLLPSLLLLTRGSPARPLHYLGLINHRLHPLLCGEDGRGGGATPLPHSCRLESLPSVWAATASLQASQGRQCAIPTLLPPLCFLHNASCCRKIAAVVCVCVCLGGDGPHETPPSISFLCKLSPSQQLPMFCLTDSTCAGRIKHHCFVFFPFLCLCVVLPPGFRVRIQMDSTPALVLLSHTLLLLPVC